MGAVLDLFLNTEEESEPNPYAVYEHQLLRQEIQQLMSKIISTNASTAKYRIVVCSGPNDGKSSLINNILSALKDDLVQVTKPGEHVNHVTKKYLEYKMTLKDGHNTQFVLCDTRGINPSGDEKTFCESMYNAIKGHYSDGQDMTDTSADASLNVGPHRASNSTRDEGSSRKSAVAILFVISGDKLKAEALRELHESIQFKAMTRINEFANTHGIPSACFISKCDVMDDAVNKKIKVLYKSKKVQDSRKRLHSSFDGFPLNRIFPIVNYTKHMTVTPGMMLQTLYAMKYVMTDIDTYLNQSTYRV